MILWLITLAFVAAVSALPLAAVATGLLNYYREVRHADHHG